MRWLGPRVGRTTGALPAEKQVAAALGFGESYDVPYGCRACQYGYKAVDAWGDAAVGRRSVFERLQKLTEPGVHLVLRIAQYFEYLLLQAPMVDPDAAAGQLRPVAHQVISL